MNEFYKKRRELFRETGSDVTPRKRPKQYDSAIAVLPQVEFVTKNKRVQCINNPPMLLTNLMVHHPAYVGPYGDYRQTEFNKELDMDAAHWSIVLHEREPESPLFLAFQKIEEQFLGYLANQQEKTRSEMYDDPLFKKVLSIDDHGMCITAKDKVIRAKVQWNAGVMPDLDNDPDSTIATFLLAHPLLALQAPPTVLNGPVGVGDCVDAVVKVQCYSFEKGFGLTLKLLSIVAEPKQT